MRDHVLLPGLIGKHSGVCDYNLTTGLSRFFTRVSDKDQGFTFNWFNQLDAHYPFTKRQAIPASAYFPDHSNLGMAHPNPGIDVLGLNLGMVWQLD